MSIPPPPPTPLPLTQFPVATSASPTDLYYTVQSGISKQIPASLVSGGGSFGPQAANTTFSGPATGAAANPTFRALVTADLPSTAVTPGSYGSTTQVGTFTVDATGRITAAANASIDVPGSLGNQTANTVLAGPTTGGAAAPAFRVLVNADIPAALTGKTYNGLTVTSTTGTLTLANGSTLATAGAFSGTLTMTGATNVTLPTTGTLATLAGSETLTNKALNGTLGATTPSTAVVTTLNTSGAIIAGGNLGLNIAAGTAEIVLNATAGNVRRVLGQTSSSSRWSFVLGNATAETGANAGSDCVLSNLSDTGVSLGSPIQVNRATGNIVLGSQGGSSGSLEVIPAASSNRRVTVTGSNVGSPILGTSNGSLIIAPAGTEVVRAVQGGGMILGVGTAVPAGGTAGLGYMFSSTSNFGMFFGTGAPTLSAAQGSIYLRRDGTTINDRAYINTNGSTTWTALMTAA